MLNENLKKEIIERCKGDSFVIELALWLTGLCITIFCKRFLWMLCLPMSPFTTNITPSSLPSAKSPATKLPAVKFAKKSQIFHKIFSEWTQNVHLLGVYLL